MIKRLIQILITLISFALGIFLVSFVELMGLFNVPSGILGGAIYIITGLIFAIIVFLASPKLIDLLYKLTTNIEKELEDIPTTDIALGALGLIIGLIIAFFISQPFYNIPIVGTLLAIGVYVILVYLGIRIALKSKKDISEALSSFSSDRVKEAEEIVEIALNTRKSKVKNMDRTKSYKILDTSVIIDGRIVDIIKAGFIEGTLVIPNFVLLELQHIADSSDELRRERGRRGLDILKEIQDQDQLEIVISEELYEDIEEVDSKLLAMAEDLNGKVITNDFNLNKVAEVRGIEVLNINELANAVKAPVIHGETISVSIVKEGSEEGQGVAYLDDGTMIVIEGGSSFIGQVKDVIVTSVIQTSAGKMIFTKVK